MRPLSSLSLVLIPPCIALAACSSGTSPGTGGAPSGGSQSVAGNSPMAGSGGAPASSGGMAGLGGGGSGGMAQPESGAGGMPNGGGPNPEAGAAGMTSGGAGAGGMSGGGAGGGAGAPSVGTGCNETTICWDFEEGTIPAGFTPWRTAGTGELLVDNTRPYGASQYSLHAKDLQGGPQHSLKYVLPADFGPVMWGRMRLYTTPERPMAHAGFFNARYPVPGQPDDAPENQLNWYEVASFEQSYMSIFHPPWPPGFPEDVQVSDTQLVLDQWTCVEWLFDGENAGDATQAALPKVWLDGVELAWPRHFTYSEPEGAPAPFRDKVGNFTVIELGIVAWQEIPTATSWWIDDVGIGKERIGCN